MRHVEAACLLTRLPAEPAPSARPAAPGPVAYRIDTASARAFLVHGLGKHGLGKHAPRTPDRGTMAKGGRVGDSPWPRAS